MNDVQSTFLLTLSRLYLETKTYVPESRIREAWPECPPHDVLLELGLGLYFYQHPEDRSAYMPTENCFSLAGERERIIQLQAELQKMRNDFDQYRTDEAAYHAAQDLQRKKENKRAFVLNIFSSTVAAIIGGLVVYYWPCILAGIHSIVH